MKVEYIDHMGTDLSVVNAARVSFDKESEWEYDTEVEEFYTEEAGANSGVIVEQFHYNVNPHLKKADVKLINYLAKHNHFTPFTHATVTFRWTVPIFMARQLLKHQIGLSVNEISRRYVDDQPTFFMPDQWRARHESAKQGSKADEFITELEWVSHYDPADEYGGGEQTFMRCQSVSGLVQAFNEHALWTYKTLLQNNVCPEQARMVLPQSMYTSFYWTGSLSAWGRVHNLRDKPEAQLEHKVLMEQLSEKMSELFPVSWEALTKSE